MSGGSDVQAKIYPPATQTENYVELLLRGSITNLRRQDFARDASPHEARGVLFGSFLSMALLFLCTATACESSSAPKRRTPESVAVSGSKTSAPENHQGTGNTAQVIARLEDAAIVESSGIAASRRNPDLFWTHNDSGDGPFIFAFDRQGKRRGVWRVEGAKARDWEDIAVGPGPEQGLSYLYLGDIGDNGETREEIVVYRIPEPAIAANDAAASKTNPLRTETAEVIRAQYPDGAHNAEALLVHPRSGDIYIATKTTAPTTVIYKLSSKLSTTALNRLARIAEISIPSFVGALVTGGAISPDGERVVLCDYLGAYELRLPADATAGFDAIWTQPLLTLPIGPRGQGEAVGYSLDGKSILTTSEGRNSPILELRFN